MGPSTSIRTRTSVIVLVAALLAVLVPATPAEAVDVRTSGTTRLLGDTSVQRLDIRVGNARARGDAIWFSTTDDRIELRPRLAQGTAVGLSRMSAFAATEFRRGGIAGVNGGYWLSRPAGVPNGLYVERDRMVAADSVSASNLPARRAIAGIDPAGRLVADRIRVLLDLDIPHLGREGIAIDELNRNGSGLLLFDTRLGASMAVPSGSVLLILDELRLGSSGRVTATVRERRRPSATTSWRAQEGTTVLMATSSRASVLDNIDVGDTIGVTTRIVPDGTAASAWDGLRSAIPGGGLLIRDGRISSGSAMASEGLSHASTRRARTGIGQRADGRTVLVTIDERNGSSGVTLFEFAQVMAAMGAVNAVALDGGGSTSMVVAGQQRNRPSDPNRGQSSALFLYAEPPPPSRGLAGACPSGVPSGGFRDTGSTVHRDAIDCLAWWGVTSGVTPTSYAPGQQVSRAQMASFLARWIDDLATRGDGRALADEAPLPFRDVPSGDVHARAIARLSAAGVVNGRTATSFDPNAPVTRAETASLLRRAIEYSTRTSLPSAPDTFLDDNGLVHEASIDQLAHQGVIGGVGGFDYAPNVPVSRGAMASLVMRASDLLVEQQRITPPA